MENAIEVRNLCKRYPGFALEDVSFALPSGCVLGLVGENGAGKSTIINLLMNAIRRDNGEVRVLGMDPMDPCFIRTKQDIGVVLDEAHFPELLNAMDVRRMMQSCYANWDDSLYQDYLVRFDLPERKPFKDYSRGMRMKLAIAVALSHGAKLLILDEATGGLDPMARDEMLDILNDFTRQENHSILISSHILSDLEKLCDYIAFLHQGKLLFCEEKDRLLETYALFVGTAQQMEELAGDAILDRESSGYGGVRAIVRRDAVPACLPLEKPTVEDIILAMVRKEQKR